MEERVEIPEVPASASNEDDNAGPSSDDPYEEDVSPNLFVSTYIFRIRERLCVFLTFENPLNPKHTPQVTS